MRLFPLNPVAVLLVAGVGCSGPKASPPAAAPAAAPIDRQIPLESAEHNGLYFRGATRTPEGPDALDVLRIPKADARPVTEADAERLLARLTPLTVAKTETFQLPATSRPPPTAKSTIAQPFPARAAPPRPQTIARTNTQSPLPDKTPTIVRRAPEGEVRAAPRITVTFADPVAPVTAARALDPKDAPFTVSPATPGQWRWLSTTTAVFDPAVGRLPMATTFRVASRPTWKATNGRTFDEPQAWSFSTPAPSVQRWLPTGDAVELDVLQAVFIDQPVDPDRVRPLISVMAGDRAFTVRAPTPAELDNAPEVERAPNDSPGSVVWFKTTEPLPRNQKMMVTLKPGWTGREGPRSVAQASKHAFKTYAPLAVTDHRCGWRVKCPPLTPLYITFNNTLADGFDPATLKIEPPIEQLRVEVGDHTMSLQGVTSGRTKYRITLPGTLADTHGQILGDATHVDFEIGDSLPELSSASSILAVSDPDHGPSFSVNSINYPRLLYRAWRVKPADWPKFLSLNQSRRGNPRALGRPAVSKTLRPKGDRDLLRTTTVDLKTLVGDTGHVVVEITPNRADLTGWRRNNPPVYRQWIQRTQLALQVRVDAATMLAWVSDLKTGRPVDGATVEFRPTGRKAVTDAGGLARIALPDKGIRGDGMVIATVGNDAVFVPEKQWLRGSSAWHRSEKQPRLRSFVFDDRAMYQAGETVHLKGWLRRQSGGPDGDLLPFDGAVKSITAQFYDAQNVEYAKKTVGVNAWGGFNVEFAIPADVNLGRASVLFQAAATKNTKRRRWTHGFQIQAFRRPEFEVQLEPSEAPHRVGEFATIVATARYYSGGPLIDAPVEWTTNATPTSYRPPGHPSFSFGRWVPWWSYRSPDIGPGKLTFEEYKGTTDVHGQNELRVDMLAVDPPQPHALEVLSKVEDVNRQVWSANTTLLVHPADFYVGLRLSRGFGEVNQPVDLDGRVVDIDGVPIAQRTVTATLAQIVWKKVDGQWSEREVDPVSCRSTSGLKGEFKCAFTPAVAGRYRVSAVVQDDRGRRNLSTRTLWVSGPQATADPTLEADEVTLIPDKPEYSAGDTARILVQAPFPDAEGLLTVERDGIATAERFTVKGVSHTLEVAIEDRFLPELRVAVELVGRKLAPEGDAGGTRPAFASGRVGLKVSDRARRLFVKASPAQPVLPPGAQTSIEVTVVDARGQPVSDAEVAVVVVDEAVLALTAAKTPDPLATFYKSPRSGVRTWRTRPSLILRAPQPLGGLAPGEPEMRGLAMADASMRLDSRVARERKSANDGGDSAIAVRRNFSALAVFAPSVQTGADGKAVAEFRLPDSLTRYRVMAVAADAVNRFGSAEAAITARKALMVRPSPPRFLNYGDQAEVPVVVQNQADLPMDVTLAMRASNVALGGPAGYRFTVPAGDRRELRFAVSTAEAGQATFQVAAEAGPLTDAASFELPVYTPATTEAFATYGTTTDAAIVQPLQKPSGVIEGFGGLEITTASTQLQTLTDAFVYLQNYPYGCSEQVASRVISVVALKDVLAAFKARDLPKPDAIIAAVNRDLQRLSELQALDGGWGFWSSRSSSWPFLTVHVMHAIARAQEKGFKINARTVRDGREYLRSIRENIPSTYPDAVKLSVEAYALYVRAMMGDLDERAALALIRRAGGMNALPLEVVGWLYPVLTDGRRTRTARAQMYRRLSNDATETSAEAHFVTRYEDGAHFLLHSTRRVDALILEGLLRDRPKDPLVPKIVRGLLAHRTKGRWSSTQENAWVLLALDRYFRAYERVTPDFVAGLWLGDRFAGEQVYEGRTTDQHRWFVPMAQLHDAKDILLAKKGAGRLYYRLGLQYAPTDLDLEAIDRGFSVSRRYEALEDQGDVQRSKDGTWRIRAGALVRVRITMVAPGRRYHVALTDPLPAGLEALNPALAVTDDELLPVRQEQAREPWWWYRPWFDHQNLKDTRAEAFSAAIPAGVYEYDYVARATTPGRFIVPPARAEQMYAPETFGRASTDRVVID